MRLEELLRELALAQYVEAFEAHAIDDGLLGKLDMADLKEIGVLPVGHRKRILDAIRAEQGEAEPGAAARADIDASHPAQRRHLTILFADLVGSTQLSQQLDAEDLRDLIRAYQDASKTAIERFDGYVAQYLGDGIVVYFGYPHSHEDDVERAIRASLALVKAVQEIDGDFGRAKGVAIEVRVGIEAGPVIVGDIIGEGASRERAVVGETPNLAARLQGLAAPGQVVLGPTARGLVAGSMQLKSLGPQQIKGYAEAMEIWSVQGLGFSGGRFERNRERRLSTFVGRDQELKRLTEAFARTKAGRNVIVEVVADAGLGKSRLVHEFLLRRSSATRLLSCHCASHGGATAFFPFIDMFRRLLAMDDDDTQAPSIPQIRAELRRSGLNLTNQVPYILNLLGLEDRGAAALDPDLIGAQTQPAIDSFIRHQGKILPTVLFVNDLHWIDQKSESLLLGLGESVGALGILLICTFRPDYQPKWRQPERIERILLSPLAEDDSIHLFRDQFGAGHETYIEDMLSKTGGNPLFVEELAGHFRRPGRAAQGIPDTLSGLLLERVDAQSQTAQNILRTAAVAGRRFSAPLVSGSANHQDEQPAFGELLESGLVIEDGIRQPPRYRFKHALVQDAIYDGLLAEDRKYLHGLVGHRIETLYPSRSQDFSEELSRHYEIAEAPLKAARYASIAGEKAHELFDLGNAEHWSRKAIDLFPEDADESDEILRARAISNCIEICCWEARFADMIALAEKEHRRIEKLGNVREVSTVMSWLGEANLNQSNFPAAKNFLNRALEIGEEIDDAHCIGHALGELGWLNSISLEGDPMPALRDQCDRLLGIAAKLGNYYLETLACYALWAGLTQCGRIAESRLWATRLIAKGQESGYPPALTWGYCMLSYAELCNANLELAERLVDDARGAAQCAFDHLMTDFCLGMVKARQGRFADCEKLLGRAQRLGDETGTLFFAYAGEAEYGKALAASGNLPEALLWLEDSQSYFSEVENPRADCLSALAHGDVLAGAGDLKAIDVLTNAASMAERTGMTGVLVEANLLLGRMFDTSSDHAAAQARFDAARQAAQNLGWSTLEQRANRAQAGGGTD